MLVHLHLPCSQHFTQGCSRGSVDCCVTENTITATSQCVMRTMHGGAETANTNLLFSPGFITQARSRSVWKLRSFLPGGPSSLQSCTSSGCAHDPRMGHFSNGSPPFPDLDGFASGWLYLQNYRRITDDSLK
ncbi:hypothetical protein DNTS_006154 [Danionella cerebrum]|uniref:Uncharacterized protein n=1 Tax=Danionella cerebrum TaxID=2873325 RepID=A0A553RHL9_9TELE|nr:hypothetical protein DNTS_006154 [Danionella translucida]